MSQASPLEEQALRDLRQDPLVMGAAGITIDSHTYLIGQRDCTAQNLGRMPFVVLLGDEIEDVARRGNALVRVSSLAAAIRDVATTGAVWSGVAETAGEVVAVSKGQIQIPASWTP